MKRLCTCVAGLAAFVTVCCFGRVESANAYLTFRKAFEQRYVAGAKTDVQKSLAQEVKRVKCFICHDPRPEMKKSKKNRNPYGQALNQYLTEKDKKDQAKAVEMLLKVENQKAAGSDKTFGELLREGKIPFEYKDLKVQDADEEEAEQ
jgi:hypothetical protein